MVSAFCMCRTSEPCLCGSCGSKIRLIRLNDSRTESDPPTSNCENKTIADKKESASTTEQHKIIYVSKTSFYLKFLLELDIFKPFN